MKRCFLIVALGFGVIILAGCTTSEGLDAAPPVEVKTTPAVTQTADTIPNLETAVLDIPIPGESPNRRVEMEEDYSFGHSLGFDGIRPIYEPEFLPFDEVTGIQPFDLVMGVAWGGEAKAYPLWVLRVREMVNDELAGVPTLVTW